MINFPNTPTNGQQYSFGGRTWQYNSGITVWELVAVSTTDANLAAQKAAEAAASATAALAAKVAAEAAVAGVGAGVNISEAIDDRVAGLLVAGTGITLSYDDTGNKLVITNSGAGTGTGGTPVDPTEPVDPGTPSQTVSYSPYYGPADRYFPATAVLVPWTDRANLQAQLDANKIIRLEPRSYVSGGPAFLTIRSGHQIYGIPDLTVLPDVRYEAGASDTLIKGCNANTNNNNGFFFPASTLVNERNVQGMTRGLIVGTSSTIKHALFASQVGVVEIDNTAGGSINYCRWVRQHTHNSGFASAGAFVLKGGVGRTSGGNVVIAYNALGATKAGFNIEGQRDFTAIGADQEDYELHTDGKGVMYVRDTTHLKVFNISGKGNKSDGLDTGADNNTIIWNSLEVGAGYKELIWQSNALNSLMVKSINTTSTTTDNVTANALRIRNSNGTMALNGVSTAPAGTNIAKAQALTIYQQIADTYQWGFPGERAVPNPGGVNWNVGLASRPDEAPAIQALLNANTVVQLEGRPYYIASPLLMKIGQVIMGVPGQTVIIGKTQTIALLKTNFAGATSVPVTGVVTAGFTLIDLVFQGGLHGFHQTQPNIQLNSFYVINTVFRDQADTGMFIDNSYAWDNGWLEHVDFYNCGVAGIRQRGTSTNGQDPTIAYIDKTNFFRCQWINCGKALDLFPTRGNNLNTWTECLLKNNAQGALDFRDGNNVAQFTNCHFVLNGGTVSCYTGIQPVGYVGCRFEASAANVALLSWNAVTEGCVFVRGTTSTAVIFDPSLNVVYQQYIKNPLSLNNNSVDVPLGPVDVAPSALSITSVNSTYPTVDNRWNKAVAANLYDTKSTQSTADDTRSSQLTWLDGVASPGTRFLRDLGLFIPGVDIEPTFLNSFLNGTSGGTPGTFDFLVKFLNEVN